MGQYHHFASLDKGISISPHQFGTGAKLLEFTSGGYGHTMSIIGLAISPLGPFYGDRVALVGDYAGPGDLRPGLPYASDPRALYDQQAPTSLIQDLRALLTATTGVSAPNEHGTDPGDVDLLASIISNPGPDPIHGELFVVNQDTGQYLDPHSFGSGRNLGAILIRADATLLATALLLPISNGRGGGDYSEGGPHPHLIGSWAGSHIAITTRPRAGTDISLLVRAQLAATSQGRFDLSACAHLGSLPEWLLPAGRKLAASLAASPLEGELAAALVDSGFAPHAAVAMATKLSPSSARPTVLHQTLSPARP